MKSICVFLLALAFVQTATPANLAVSTYLGDGFIPSAIASDAAGNVFIAGSVVTDPASGTTSAVVAKLGPDASQRLYMTYFDSAASDQLSAIAVDPAGNAYVAGWTANPNFPNVVAGGAAAVLGTEPTGARDTRAFVAKINPDGAVMYSVLLGGSTSAQTRGIAVTSAGQLLVSGIANSPGITATTGALSLGDSSNLWFLTELSAGASGVVFTATGVGGSSIVLDATGNIYMAGSAPGTDYPTTPGAYQTTFVQGHICSFLCQLGVNGGLQHLTKVDSTGSKLIYSTGINDTTGAAGSTTNTGLTIDSAGNAYVTGTLTEASYPLTVTPPAQYSSFLTKLDPIGSNVLFSVPIGGAGVALDSAGVVYVGGTVSSYNLLQLTGNTTPVAPPAVFSWLPQPCLPDNITALGGAYVMKVDPASGNVVDGQWIDGSNPGATGIAIGSGNVWITGVTPGADIPLTAGTLTLPSLGPGYSAGSYVSAAGFAGGPNTGPAVACVLDAGNLTHTGPVAAYQLLAIFGRGLGPVQGVTAPDGMDPVIAGVSVTFDGNPAQLLYVSATQINLAVPSPIPTQEETSYPTTTVMQINVNGATIEREFPLAVSNMNLFATLTSNEQNCMAAGQIPNGYQPVALNADGSLNSCTNPAKLGSAVSFFMQGAGGEQLGIPLPGQLTNVEAFVGECAAPVISASLGSNFVYQVSVTMPEAVSVCATAGYSPTHAENPYAVTFSYNGAAVGPRTVPNPGQPSENFIADQPMPMIVWVTE